MYLSPGADFYQGDVRNRDLLANLLRRVDAVYHFAAYQDYLPDFSRFSDVNVVSTALIYEIIVAERLDMARVVVASSQSAMGEGLYRCPADGEQLPGMRPESALAAGQWDIPCPRCGGPLEMQATPERISNPQNAYGMSKLGEEMVAINLGRRYGIPTVALRYSIVQGPRQSVYNAYSGACRIFCLSYLQGLAPDPVRGRRGHPRLRQHRRRSGRQRARAHRRTGRRAGLQRRRWPGRHDPGIFRHRDAPVRVGRARRGDRRVPLRRHAPHPLRHQRPAGARLAAAAHAGRLGGGVRRVAQGHGRPRRGAGRGERADARPRRGPEGRRREGLPARRRDWAAGCGRSPTPSRNAWWPSTASRCSTSGSTRSTAAGVDEVLVNLHHLPDVVRRHLAARTGPPAVRMVFEPELLGSAGTLDRQPGLGRRATSSFLACNADNLTDFDLRSLIEAHREHGAIATLTVFHSERPSAGGVVEIDADGTGHRVHREASQPGLRPGECRHVRLPPERAR